MKIDELETIPIAIDRNEVFRISTGSSLTAENVIVKVRSDNVTGWGNASANSVTQESVESILKASEGMRSEVEGKDIELEEVWEKLREKLPGNPAAIAGLDIALHDLKGKLEEKKIWDMYGGREQGVLTDRTIGLMTKTETREHASKFIEKGFKAIKIKIGFGVLEDLRRIQAVRDIVGKDTDIWVDANQAFTPEEAITLCQKLKNLDIQFVEQPVREGDLEGLKKVTSETDIPIMADETIKSPEMAEKICTEELADMINIKLMKSAGLTGGRKIVEIMEDYSVQGMVGCMGETSISIAAGAHLHQTTENLRYADLDSHFMLSDNIASGLDFKDGKLWTSDKPGLGVDVDKEKMEDHRMELEAIS
ncbi:MAG: dipeptide epimerase [Candidatus Thermoplasmatota archaeon]|nr:dipeptide epimerase [Candidatus Thermoplasmatota archaeon]